MENFEKIQTIEQTNETFKINFENSSLKFKCFLKDNDICVDISKLNLIQAIKIAILTSTHCFLNGFENNLCWLVKDLVIKDAISILCLKNTKCKVLDKVLHRKAA